MYNIFNVRYTLDSAGVQHFTCRSSKRCTPRTDHAERAPKFVMLLKHKHANVWLVNALGTTLR